MDQLMQIKLIKYESRRKKQAPGTANDRPRLKLAVCPTSLRCCLIMPRQAEPLVNHRPAGWWWHNPESAREKALIDKPRSSPEDARRSDMEVNYVWLHVEALLTALTHVFGNLNLPSWTVEAIPNQIFLQEL